MGSHWLNAWNAIIPTPEIIINEAKAMAMAIFLFSDGDFKMHGLLNKGPYDRHILGQSEYEIQCCNQDRRSNDEHWEPQGTQCNR